MCVLSVCISAASKLDWFVSFFLFFLSSHEVTHTNNYDIDAYGLSRSGSMLLEVFMSLFASTKTTGLWGSFPQSPLSS